MLAAGAGCLLGWTRQKEMRVSGELKVWLASYKCVKNVPEHADQVGGERREGHAKSTVIYLPQTHSVLLPQQVDALVVISALYPKWCGLGRCELL